MTTITIPAGADGFTEDKDQARKIRQDRLLPAIENGENVTLDFENVTYATQSFVHSLIGEALNQHGESLLEKVEFKNCSPQMRSLIALVVDYSLSGFAEVRAV